MRFKLESDGFGNKLVIDDYESKWVKFMYKSYEQGLSVTEIKEILENNNVVTRRGNQHWSLGSIQVILRNDTYIGIDDFNDKKSSITIRNHLPQLISNKLFENVQKRRLQILKRKGQLSKTKNFYLFRDFMYCVCGTPIGGRLNPKININHYYCPLSERKFNKSTPKEIICTMKRCVNIESTEKFLWNNIKTLLSDTLLIKEKLKATGLNQNDLAKILGHRKGYMSELINGLRPFSKEDIVVINRLFKIKLVDLIPRFIKQDRAVHIKKTLNSLSNSRIKLTKKDFDLQLA